MTYLQFAREFNARFPGFDTDIHGLVEEKAEDGSIRYFVDWSRNRSRSFERGAVRFQAGGLIYSRSYDERGSKCRPKSPSGRSVRCRAAHPLRP